MSNNTSILMQQANRENSKTPDFIISSINSKGLDSKKVHLMESILESMKEKCLAEANLIEFADELTESSLPILYKENALAKQAYHDVLTESIESSEQEEFRQYLANSHSLESRALLESTNNSFNNASSFGILEDMAIREIWNRTGAREAMTYVVAKAPTFIFPWFKQVIKQPDGSEIDIPEYIKLVNFSGKQFDGKVKFADKVAKCNIFDKFVESGAEVTTGKKLEQGSLTLATVGEIYEVVISEDGTDANDKIHTISYEKAPLKCDPMSGFGKFEITTKNSQDQLIADKLIVTVDRLSGELEFICTSGKVRSVKYRVSLSQENNQFTYTTALKPDRKEVNIGMSDHVGSELPVEFLQDFKALFNIDAMSEIVSIITNFFSTMYDRQVYDTVKRSIIQDTQKSVFDASMTMNNAHIGIPRPMHNLGVQYAIAQGMAAIDNRYNFENPTYYILCNSHEAVLLSTTIPGDYSGTLFAGGSLSFSQDRQVVKGPGGSNVVILTSKHYDKEDMLIVPKSNLTKEIVFGYFDYSQVLMTEYRSPNNQRVPYIVMQKRKAIETFRPDATHCVTVKNAIQR